VLDAAGLALDWQLLGLFTGVGAVGSLVGQKLASRLPQTLLRRGFAALLVVMGLTIVGRELPALLAS
jgi:uncharacterized membrane protein YfcA